MAGLLGRALVTGRNGLILVARPACEAQTPTSYFRFRNCNPQICQPSAGLAPIIELQFVSSPPIVLLILRIIVHESVPVTNSAN